MRRVIKKPTTFINNINVDDMVQFYKIKYPKGKQPTKDMFTKDGEIDLTKLTPNEQLATLRAQLLPTKVWMIETDEDLNKILDYLDKHDFISMDTETNNPNKVHFPSVYVWSIAVKPTESFVIPYKFNKQMAEYLTTTDKHIVMHNAGYDARIVYHMTGKHIKNYEDTMILEYCYVNDSYNTPSLSLKNLAKSVFGSWSESVTDLTPDCINNDNLLYYAGIDAASTIWLFNKRKQDREKTPTVDLFDIYPMEHPNKRSYSRYWFYKNVAKQILPLTYEFTENGIHFDIEKLKDLDTRLEETINILYANVKNMPTVMKAWSEMRDKLAINKSRSYEEERLDKIEASTKPPKSTNQTYINKFIEIHYPDLIKPSKAVNWSVTVLKSLLGEHNPITLAVQNKDLESLRDTVVYSDTFNKVDDYFIKAKQEELVEKCSITALNKYNAAVSDFNFKVFSSAEQKKYILNKGFNISSSEKSSKTGEDSFGRKELERLLKLERDGEAREYLQACVDFSFANIIRNNFIKNILNGNLNSTMHSNFRLSGTKSWRPSSGGGSRNLDDGELGSVNLLNMPSSGNKYAKDFKKCMTVPSNEWVLITADFTALEENIMGNISKDPLKVKALSEGFDSHCLHSTTYYPRIEEILGKDDGTLAWNKAFKKATETNTELDKLRQSSKGISFALAYGAGLTGLFRAVGYMGDTFESDIRFKDYTYTTDLIERQSKDGNVYFAPENNAIWHPVEEYKHLDTKYHEFFAEAVVPAKNMHHKYHSMLYPGLNKYQQETIFEQAKKYKNVHGMLGLYINITTKLNGGTGRTITNFQYQSGSMLTLIAMEKIRRKCIELGIDKHVKPLASIYDSVYSLVRKDKDIIEQYASIAKPILEQQYIEDQSIPLGAELEISKTNWADFVKLDKIKDLEEYLNAI